MEKKSKSLLLVFLISTLTLSMITASVIPMTKIIYATINTFEEFGEENESISSGPTNLEPDAFISDESSPSSESDDGEFVTSETEDSTSDSGTEEEITDPSTSEISPSESPSISEVPKMSLTDPDGYSHQTNPAKSTLDFSKDPIQKVNSAVRDSFGGGVPNISIEIETISPTGIPQTWPGKTDTSGKSVIEVPSSIAGTWKAQVTIKSPEANGGPFTKSISWNAVESASSPPLPPSTKPKYASNIAYNPVDLSNDPRQQILTTVKDAAGKGVKDVKLTIELTNADGKSVEFLRITDANGVDEFKAPVDKVGNWKALVSVKDAAGKVVFTKEHLWKANNGGVSPPAAGSSKFVVKVTIVNNGPTSHSGAIDVTLLNGKGTVKQDTFNVKGFGQVTETLTFMSSDAPVGTNFDACGFSDLDGSGGCFSGMNTSAKKPETITIVIGNI